MEIKFLNESVIKKIFLSGKPNILNFVAKIISHATGDPYEDLKDNLQINHVSFEDDNGCCLSFYDGKTYYGFDVNYGDNEIASFKTLMHAYSLFDQQYYISKPVKMISINTRFKNSFERKRIVDEFYMMSDDGIKETDLLTIYDIDLLFYENLELDAIEQDELLKDLMLFVSNDEELLKTIYKDNPEALAVMDILKKMKSLYISEKDIQELGDLL